MLTSKQRSKLRSLANRVEPIAQIGKGGITDNVVNGIYAALEARELVKITVLKNSLEEARDLIGEIAEACNAEPVAAIGSKIILYRRSRKDIDHIELD